MSQKRPIGTVAGCYPRVRQSGFSCSPPIRRQQTRGTYLFQPRRVATLISLNLIIGAGGADLADLLNYGAKVLVVPRVHGTFDRRLIRENNLKLRLEVSSKTHGFNRGEGNRDIEKLCMSLRMKSNQMLRPNS